VSEQVKLEEIVILPEIQIRISIRAKTVEEYASAMGEGVKFDDIDLFVDDQGRKILADGAHRFLAAQNRGLKTISAEIHKCEPAEAFSQALEMSLRKNCSHGLRLTPADKRRAVKLALEDKRIRKMGDRPISIICGVSPQLVKDVRKGDDKDVDVSDHKRSKPKPRSIPEEVVEDSDPTDERVRTLKEWVSSGKIDWPDIAAVFTNKERVALLIPRRSKLRLIAKNNRKIAKLVSVEMLHGGEDPILEIELESINADSGS
jgi:uncharacterized ParB-like nuclease family protein